MNSQSRSRWRGIERGGRLVEEQHGRLRQQSDGDVDPLLVAAREAARPRRRRGPPGRSARASRATAASGSASFSSRANRRRFSATESLEYSAGCCGTQPTACRAGRTQARPRSARATPARIESSVVLPAPLGPMIADQLAREQLEADRLRAPARSPKRLVSERTASGSAPSPCPRWSAPRGGYSLACARAAQARPRSGGRRRPLERAGTRGSERIGPPPARMIRRRPSDGSPGPSMVRRAVRCPGPIRQAPRRGPRTGGAARSPRLEHQVARR